MVESTDHLAKKLNHRWVGPYKIMKVVGDRLIDWLVLLILHMRFMIAQPRVHPFWFFSLHGVSYNVCWDSTCELPLSLHYSCDLQPLQSRQASLCYLNRTALRHLGNNSCHLVQRSGQ